MAKSMNPSVSRLEVWLVDDRAESSLLLMEILNREAGIHCSRHFSSALAMLSALEQGMAPDVIMLDVEMPVMSGIEAIHLVKKTAPDTAVLMLTMFYNPVRKQQSLDAGAKNYLLKHRPISELVAAVRAARS